MMTVPEGVSDKSRAVALLLCGILGWLGAHRFYVGKIGTGILMIVTFGGFGLWLLIDLVCVTLGLFRDKQGRVVFRWFEEGAI
jgi:TM2 domain-containing membrane protein YozV